jgi:hypothetical protein
VPDDWAERLTLIFIGISANYGDNKIFFIRLDYGMGIRGRDIAQKERFVLQKCNKPCQQAPYFVIRVEARSHRASTKQEGRKDIERSHQAVKVIICFFASAGG